jgi:lipoate-protein ligase A
MNTLRFYEWKPSAVSIGRFQDIQKETQIENCRKLDIDIVRRITGGGAVYHDEYNEVTYSVVTSKESLQADNIINVYRKIYLGLTEGLKNLGVSVDFNEGNAKTCPNLTVKGRKISGSAQCHRSGVILQHGTILADVNLETMFTVLRSARGGNCTQILPIARRKITSLTDELARKIPRSELIHALTDGFREALHINLVEGDLAPSERELAETLYRERYSTKPWNFKASGIGKSTSTLCLEQ